MISTVMDSVLKGKGNDAHRVFALLSLRIVHGFSLKSSSGTMRRWEVEDWCQCLVIKAGSQIREYQDLRMEESYEGY